MPKYAGKTYSRARKRECKSSSIFDEVQNEGTTSDDDNNTSEASLVAAMPKKSSWSRVHKAVAKTQENSPVKNGPKSSKRAKKLPAIDEQDPFAFTDEDDLSLQNSQTSSQKTVDPSDKSTDDEAYSSSQELGESSSKSSGGKSKNAKTSSSVSNIFANSTTFELDFLAVFLCLLIHSSKFVH